jgi:hypothetical protein
MLSVVRIEPDHKGTMHHHPEEQWGVCLEGSATRFQGDEAIEVRQGDFWRTPGGVPHTMQAGPEGCTVLADEAVAVSDLDPGAVEAELRDLEGAAASLRESVARLSGPERDAAQRELAQAERRQAAVEVKLAAARERSAAAH